MSEHIKGISVNLIIHNLRSFFPEYSVCLGNISTDQFRKIRTEIAASIYDESTCMRSLCMDYHENMTFGIIRKPTHTERLNISGMSWLNTDKTPLCQNCSDKTGREKINICVRNLRDGKCRDTLIRRTLGAALFPQFYQNQKQK